MKRILLATDLGVMSPFIMTYAIDMARQSHAKLDVVHIVEPMGVFAESIINAYVPTDDLKHLRETGVQHVMSNIKAQIIDHIQSDFTEDDEDYIGEIQVLNGEVSETLLNLVRSKGYEYVVLGGHNTISVNNSALGSTASKLLQLSPVPVMVVPISRFNSGVSSQGATSFRAV